MQPTDQPPWGLRWRFFGSFNFRYSLLRRRLWRPISGKKAAFIFFPFNQWLQLLQQRISDIGCGWIKKDLACLALLSKLGVLDWKSFLSVPFAFLARFFPYSLGLLRFLLFISISFFRTFSCQVNKPDENQISVPKLEGHYSRTSYSTVANLSAPQLKNR